MSRVYSNRKNHHELRTKIEINRGRIEETCAVRFAAELGRTCEDSRNRRVWIRREFL